MFLFRENCIWIMLFNNKEKRIFGNFYFLKPSVKTSTMFITLRKHYKNIPSNIYWITNKFITERE